ncbi:hypothetical protein BDD12DRAFT_889657 [Trichophaea hybrida]|nr:hypothetical protein BDD12DRAFT_889657 [Trichophaea hybrida]
MVELLKTEVSEKHFQQLSALEKDFEKVDLEIRAMRSPTQSPASSLTFLKTPRVQPALMSTLPPEDAEVLTHVTEIKVTRPNAEKGDPRDIELSDRFGLTGLVSTPTPITWKDTKDLTCGVGKAAIEAAIEAFEGRKAKAASREKKGKSSVKLGPKEEALIDLLSKNSASFFTWFSFTGVHHELGEFEDEVDDFDNMDDDGDDDEKPTGPIETFPYGDELAIQFAEDVYPAAVKYFTASLEESDDEEDIDLDSDLEEQLAKQASHAGCAGGKHKHSHGDTSSEPAKKKAKK